MAKPSPDLAPPHEFPFWPFSCMTFYSHAMRDFGRYSQALTSATDPAQAARAESDYGLSLWQDLMQAYCDLALLPMTLAAKVAAPAPAAAEESAPSSRAADE